MNTGLNKRWASGLILFSGDKFSLKNFKELKFQGFESQKTPIWSYLSVRLKFMISHSWYNTTSYLFYGLRYYFLAYKYAVLHAEASEDFPKVTKLEEGKNERWVEEFHTESEIREKKGGP